MKRSVRSATTFVRSITSSLSFAWRSVLLSPSFVWSRPVCVEPHQNSNRLHLQTQWRHTHTHTAEYIGCAESEQDQTIMQTETATPKYHTNGVAAAAAHHCFVVQWKNCIGRHCWREKIILFFSSSIARETQLPIFFSVFLYKIRSDPNNNFQSFQFHSIFSRSFRFGFFGVVTWT